MRETLQQSLKDARLDHEEFIDICQWRVWEIRSAHHADVPGYAFDETTGIYDKEQQAMDRIKEACKYLPAEGQQLVEKAMWLAMLAHLHHYRESQEPFSMHAFAVGLGVATDVDRPSAETIAVAISHDNIEDTQESPYVHFTRENLAALLGPVIAEDVYDLSQKKARHLMKNSVKEFARQQIIHSLLKNIRVARVKLEDVRQNMRTLAGKKNPDSRRAAIISARRVFIPLALRLGRPDIAEELDYLCLLHGERTDQRRLQTAKRRHDQLAGGFRPDAVLSLLSDDFQIPEKTMRALVPSVASMYRDPEGRSHINIDVSLDQYSADSKAWVREAFDLAGKFILDNPNYSVAKLSSMSELYTMVKAGRADSLEFMLERLDDRARFHIHIYPKDVFELEPVRMTALLTHEHELPKEEAEYQELARRKHRVFLMRLQRVLDSFDPATDDASQVMQQVETRKQAGYISVIGENNRGEHEPWDVPEGSTMLDYARSIRTDWAAAESAKVNGIPVMLDHVIQPGDIVHVRFAPKVHYDPRSIHWFRTDEAGKQEVREYMNLLLQEDISEKYHAVFDSLLSSGHNVLQQFIPESERPFLYGLMSERAKPLVKQSVVQVMEYIAQHNLTNVWKLMSKGNSDGFIEELFYFGVAMDILPHETIEEIMKRARPENAKVITVALPFTENEEGQLELVSKVAREMGINMLSNNATPHGSMVVIRLYLSPTDAERVGELKKRLEEHEELRRKQLEIVWIGRLGENKQFFELESKIRRNIPPHR